MTYHIDAWLDDGEPCLELIDADSSHVRLAWRADTDAASRPALHQLFRELLLISAADHTTPAATPVSLASKSP